MLAVERSMSTTSSLDRQTSQEIQTITPTATEDLHQHQHQQPLEETKSIQLSEINPAALPSYSNLGYELGDDRGESPPVYNDLFHEQSDDDFSWLDRV